MAFERGASRKRARQPLIDATSADAIFDARVMATENGIGNRST